MRGFPPQQPGAQRVKRRDPHLPAVDADLRARPGSAVSRSRGEQGFDARTHLLCSLVREGDRQHLVGLRGATAHQVSDAVGDDPGLTGSGAGQDEKRPLSVENGFLLFGIETREKIQMSILP